MHGVRIIDGLVAAHACARPATIPVGRPRGKKAAGVRYEKLLAAAIPAAKHGQWWRFVDVKGPGYCQTDLLLATDWGFAILEAKYTWTEVGHQQVARLYKPVVEFATGQRAFGIEVCKVLTPAVEREWVCSSLDEAIGRASAGYKTVLHWLGVGLGPLARGGKTSPLAMQQAGL